MIDFKAMIEGYHRFRAGDWSRQHARWSQLAEGQDPKLMVIACSDSRVDPSQIFDTSPGEMFVVRNIANLVPPFELGGGRHGVSAAIEFAVTQLEVPEIVVLGHGQCGGVAASLSRRFEGARPGEGGFIAHWVDLLDEARDRIVAEHGDHAHTLMEYEAVKVSLDNIRTFPCIPARLASGILRLHGDHFAIADGILRVLDEDSGEFKPVQ